MFWWMNEWTDGWVHELVYCWMWEGKGRERRREQGARMAYEFSSAGHVFVPCFFWSSWYPFCCTLSYFSILQSFARNSTMCLSLSTEKLIMELMITAKYPKQKAHIISTRDWYTRNLRKTLRTREAAEDVKSMFQLRPCNDDEDRILTGSRC